MKTKIFAQLLSFCLLPSAFCLSLRAQGTAFTYQGRLTDGGSPANGSYDLRLRLFADDLGNTLVSSNVFVDDLAVTNGLLIVALDFGAAVFDGSARWLEIGVRGGASAGSYTILNPLTPVYSTPYAIRAAQLTGTVSSNSLAGAYGNAVTFVNPANSFAGTFAGNGSGLTNLNAVTLAGISPANLWQLGGNSVAPGQFLGSTNNQPLELRVSGLRALRFELAPNNASHSNIINVVNGSPVNLVALGVYAATISGGGAQNYFGVAYTNRVASDIGTIAGGVGNSIEANSAGATIGGGSRNRIQTLAPNALIAGGVDNTIQTGSGYSTISGGYLNTIRSNSSSFSVIAGGIQHALGSPYATIGGGALNSIGTNSNSSTISGGYNHLIWENSFDCTIGGGSFSVIGTNSYYSTVAGGRINFIGDNSTSSTVGGGVQNAVDTNSVASTIGGGSNNIVAGAYGTVAGGVRNRATGGPAATVAGGQGNTAGGHYTAVGGGLNNTAIGYTSAIGGGGSNLIETNADHSVIAGGLVNRIQPLSFRSAIGGGEANVITASVDYGTISGGQNNSIQFNADWSTIGGGGRNTALLGANYAVVPGGLSNSVASFAFAAGNGAQATNQGAFVWNDSAGTPTGSTNNDSITLRARGGYRLFSDGGTNGVYLAPGGGSWINMSDRNAKENFNPVDPRVVLDKVVALPLQTWNYRSQAPSIRHLGPTAQDFSAAFELGETATGIASVDADGVALAAIQGLNQKLDSETITLLETMKRLDAENVELRRRLESLENRFQARD